MSVAAPEQVSLRILLADFPLPVLSPVGEAQVKRIVVDSRQVAPGDLFVAVTGGQVDGHRFIPQAIQRGAAAVIGTQPIGKLAVPYVQVGDSRRAVPYLAAAFYGHPARRLTMIGITGTDGKTTTANLIFHILQAAGHKPGMITTVNAVIGDEVLDTGFHVTTPDAQDVQRYLRRMADAGLTHAVIETTSHGLAQYRVDACEFDVGVVTNITHEHLDFHGTLENYRAAKGRLFEMLALTPEKPRGAIRTAVLNRDDTSFEFLQDLIGRTNLGSGKDPIRIISYGFHPEADIRPARVAQDSRRLHFSIEGLGARLSVSTSLIGAYNVSNCMAAAAAAAALGAPGEAVCQGIAAYPGAPGRMERIDRGQDFLAMVDFAHTPNALQRSLETARQLTQGKVIVVFGSAGLRDRAKRRMMAEIALKLADASIFTAEDPRTEKLSLILDDMAMGAVSQGGEEGRNFWRISHRPDALRFAVSIAQPGDILLACGKGHEQSMCFGSTEYPWDDRVALRSALADLLGIPGPEMPYLPTQDDKME